MKKTMQHLIMIVAGLSMCLLTACGFGFHLRGVDEDRIFPFKRLQVIAPVDELSNTLQRKLAQQPGLVLLQLDAQTPGTPNNADATLTVQGERFEQRLSTVYPSGQGYEYQLIYYVQFQLAKDKQQWIPSTHLTLFRTFTAPQNNVYGSADQLNILLRDLRLDAAHQIMRRLAATKQPINAPLPTSENEKADSVNSTDNAEPARPGR